MKRGIVVTLAFLLIFSIVFASNELTVSPLITTNTSNISLSINTTNTSTVWVNITHPDGTIESIFNDTNITYTNISQTGRYNLTYWVNDSGNITNTTNYFEIFAPYDYISTVHGWNSTNLTHDYTFFLSRNVQYNGTSNNTFTLEIPDTTFDLKYEFSSEDLEIYFDEINTTQSNKTIKLDSLTSITGYHLVYAINSTYNVSNTTIKIYYENISITNELLAGLHKCNNWSFVNRTCLGNWTNITSNYDRNTANDFFTYTFNRTIDFALGINETTEEEEEDEDEGEEGTSETTETTEETTTVSPPSQEDLQSDETPEWNLSDYSFSVEENETIEIISEGGEYQVVLGNTTYNVSIYNITEEGAQFDIAGKTYHILFHETKEFTIDEHALRISYLERSEDKVKIAFTRVASSIELNASPIFGAIYEFVGGVLARNMIVLITITLLSAIIAHRDTPKKKKSSSKKKK